MIVKLNISIVYYKKKEKEIFIKETKLLRLSYFGLKFYYTNAKNNKEWQ